MATLGQFWLADQRIGDGITFAFDTIERFAADPPPSWHRAVAASTILTNARNVDPDQAILRAALHLAREADDTSSVVRLEVRAALDRMIVDSPTDDTLVRFRRPPRTRHVRRRREHGTQLG